MAGYKTCASIAVVGLAIAAAPAAAQTADACPNGWSPEETVSFSPPVPAIETGVPNPERADGCTLLDVIWDGEPFPSHERFVSTVTRATREFSLTGRERRVVRAAARRSDVGTSNDHQLDNSCPTRVAFTFDDGISSYRPRTLQALRDKQVHGVFYDNGVRVAANPHIAAFQVREGHVQLNHTYNHPHLNQLSDAAVIDEVVRNEAVLEAAGAPLTYKGFRPPFFEADARVRALLIGLGYTLSLGAVQTDDWEPARTATEIRDEIVRQLAPGAVILLHDGPIDTPAGAASLEALGQIIDIARTRGFCFGVTDATGEVVADRYVASRERIPQIVNPVPYNALVRPGTPPEPFVFTEGPLAVATTHSPPTFARGQVGNTLTVVVSNRSDDPTDGSTVTMTDGMPAGLTATAAGGNGWTCTGTATIRCTRADALAPRATYPPITITVDVAADAPALVTHAPAVAGHGGVWTDAASDPIEVATGSGPPR
jgi:peptidoglycan/xylan/chitin deacetylase (PgdA/CDA1 family)